MAALSFSVHSATTLALISFMYNMKALSGFLMWGFFSSSFFTVTGDFLRRAGQGVRIGVDVTPSPSPSLSPGPPLPIPTHELPLGLALGWAGSCFTMGETMVGCGMPEGCSPWAGGGTMCGEKRLDIRLQRGEREPRQLPTGAKNPVPPQILPRTSGGGYGNTGSNLPGGCFHVRARPCWQRGSQPGGTPLFTHGDHPQVFLAKEATAASGPGCTHMEVSEHPRPVLLQPRVPHRPQEVAKTLQQLEDTQGGSLVPAKSHLDVETHLDTGTHLDMEAFMARAG